MDICCIQFRQDCGAGCGGLADGYSRIQLLDNGNLEICSNVGGVCDCCTPACDIVVPDTCDEGGVGDDYAIRTFDLVDGVLTVGGAPEHYSVSDDTRNVSQPGTPMPALPGPTTTVIDPAQSACLTITNPSTCRDMPIALVAKVDVIVRDVVINETTHRRFEVFLEIDNSGGSIQVDSNSQYLEENPSVLEPDSYILHTVVASDTIPAGGTETYCANFWMRAHGNNGWDITISDVSLLAFGSTE